jgi:hypothetical protein
VTEFKQRYACLCQLWSVLIIMRVCVYPLIQCGGYIVFDCTDEGKYCVYFL